MSTDKEGVELLASDIQKLKQRFGQAINAPGSRIKIKPRTKQEKDIDLCRLLTDAVKMINRLGKVAVDNTKHIKVEPLPDTSDETLYVCATRDDMNCDPKSLGINMRKGSIRQLEKYKHEESLFIVKVRSEGAMENRYRLVSSEEEARGLKVLFNV